MGKEFWRIKLKFIAVLSVALLVLGGVTLAKEEEQTFWYCSVYSDGETTTRKVMTTQGKILDFFSSEMDNYYKNADGTELKRLIYIRLFELNDYTDHRWRLKNGFSVRDYCLKNYVLLPEDFDDTPPKEYFYNE